ncbi:hypothetical protein Clacol_004042 [Clathrus columnatus]|uniref:Uncharacterized protein n=1 Tax=Clathrus columnatus TaxID=1419009 RepID=A0AAV5A9H2_9AGAM|nr:hypothetical protein Clacol_004042 [Clathrus columnatus]
MSFVPPSGLFQIINLATSGYVLRGNLNQPLRTGPPGSDIATFKITRFEGSYTLSEVDGLKPVPSASVQSTTFGLFTNNQFQSDLKTVIWGQFDAPWEAQAGGREQINIRLIPEQPNTFWTDVGNTVLLQERAFSSNWSFVRIGPDAE